MKKIAFCAMISLLLVCMLGVFSVSALEGLPNHVIINQAYAAVDNGGSISHGFVELYNPTDSDIDLSGYSLQYTVGKGNWDNVLELDGYTIKARASFLIRGAGFGGSPRYTITDYDIDWNVTFSNQSFNFALVTGTQALANAELDAADLARVVDLLGAINGSKNAVYNWEGASALDGISKQKACRRINFADYDDNAHDFEALDYRSSGIDNDRLAEVKPRYSGDGAWGEDIIPAPWILDDNEIVLSAQPGVYSEEFNLAVSVPTKSDAVIYWSIDGSDPVPGADRYITKGNTTHQVSGSFMQGEVIDVRDRSCAWENSLLTSLSQQFGAPPLAGTTTLQGTSFRFKGYVGNNAVTKTITASYIITPDAAERFNNMPIISITAGHDDFYEVYSHANPFDEITYRRDFNYEYFDLNDGVYTERFNLPGSTQLGGTGSRGMPQRTFNVSLVRGGLNGVVNYPIFSDLDELYRFRLWNAGNGFNWDHMRDIFAQSASAGMNVGTAGYQVAIMFINGEYWGFTLMREHTSNAEFISTRYNIALNNAAVIDRGWAFNSSGGQYFYDMVEDGNTNTVTALYDEVVEFAKTHDMNSDYAREILFEKYFDQENFMDYLIANTFFNSIDWPHNNMRFFRAITPNPDSGNPYEDGKWRFLLHDMDMSPHPGADQLYGNRFSTLYNPYDIAPEFNKIFLVFNNKTFVAQFVARAKVVLENYYSAAQLTALQDDIIAKIRPLVTDMDSRFYQSATNPIERFDHYADDLRNFIVNRQVIYLSQLEALANRLYTVEYDANGGTGAPETQVKRGSNALTLSTVVPVREGYTFKGWALTNNASSALYLSGGSYTSNASVKLYAVWEKIPEFFTVEYNANGGTGAPESQVKSESDVLILSDKVPARAGYTFKGWATSSNETTASYQPGDVYNANASMTLYAVWEIIPAKTCGCCDEHNHDSTVFGRFACFICKIVQFVRKLFNIA